MSFNANEFRSNLQYGGVRPNLFQVDMVIPDSDDASKALSFQAHATSMPAYVTGFVDQFYFGRRVSFFGDREYQDWQIQVINDEDYKVRNALESWSNRGVSTNWDSGYTELSGGLPLYIDASITAFAKDGAIIKTIQLKNAFPIMLGPLEFNWQENNRIQTFDATFRFDYFIPGK
jgi:hypothetical protein